MKRKLLVIVGLLALMAAPAFCDWRFDVGIDVVLGLGALSDSSIETSGGLGYMLVPMGEVGYEFELGGFGIGAGLRAGLFPLVFVNMGFLWPDIFSEVELGPVALEAHLGGLWFGYFVSVPMFDVFESGSASGNVFVPELSGWFKIGKSFRLGVGAVGLWMPDLDVDAAVFLYYVGAKWVLPGK